MSHYSAPEGPVSVASCQIENSISEYRPKPSQMPPFTHVHEPSIAPVRPFTIDYSRFINEFSSKRQPSELRELSKIIFCHYCR